MRPLAIVYAMSQLITAEFDFHADPAGSSSSSRAAPRRMSARRRSAAWRSGERRRLPRSSRRCSRPATPPSGTKRCRRCGASPGDKSARPVASPCRGRRDPAASSRRSTSWSPAVAAARGGTAIGRIAADDDRRTSADRPLWPTRCGSGFADFLPQTTPIRPPSPITSGSRSRTEERRTSGLRLQAASGQPKVLDEARIEKLIAYVESSGKPGRESRRVRRLEQGVLRGLADAAGHHARACHPPGHLSRPIASQRSRSRLVAQQDRHGDVPEPVHASVRAARAGCGRRGRGSACSPARWPGRISRTTRAYHTFLEVGARRDLAGLRRDAVDPARRR